MPPDDMFGLYLLLVATGMILIVWTMVLIAHSALINNNIEPRWLREARRASLAMVGVGLALAARWHVETGHGAWLPEYFLLSGIDLYLSTAIYSSYERMHRLGLTVH